MNALPPVYLAEPVLPWVTPTTFPWSCALSEFVRCIEWWVSLLPLAMTRESYARWYLWRRR